MKRQMDKDSPEYKAFIAVWNFWKRYGTPEDGDEYWREVLKVGSEQVALNPKFESCWDLSSELMMAVFNVLDARHKSMRRHGDERHGYEILVEEAEAVNARRMERERMGN